MDCKLMLSHQFEFLFTGVNSHKTDKALSI